MADGEKENKTETVLIRLSPSTKADWEEALENSHHDSLSGAVRGVMHRHFTNGQRDRSETIDVDLEPVHEKLDHVTDQLDDLRTQISDVQTSTEASPSTDIVHLSNEIVEMLPLVEEHLETPDELTPLRRAADMQLDRQRAIYMGTADAIADALNEKESNIRRALSVLEDDRDDVGTVEDAGFTRYYRVDPVGKDLRDINRMRDQRGEDGDE